MKINSISSTNYINNSYKQSFKHVAVPYPEYENAYIAKHTNPENKIAALINKISDLFHPEVTKEAKNIKSKIDDAYENGDVDMQMLSYFA